MKELKIDEEFKQLIPSLSKDEYKKLEELIIDEGCRDPLVLWDDIILDGHNRYKICTKHGLIFSTVHKNLDDRNAAKVWIIKNQLGKRNVSSYDKVRLNLEMEDIIEARKKAKEKQALGGKEKVSQKSAKPPIDVRELIAKKSGVSHDTVDKVKFIEKKADKKQKKALSEQGVSINTVYNKLKKAEKRKNIMETFKEPPLPKSKKKYNIILADPPWSFQHYSDKGKGKSPDNYYKCQKLQDIKDLPIGELAAKDCILFMWVTYPFLQKSFEVLKAWGFEYKTVAFTWVKKNKSGKGWFWGMGYWTRSNAEICLLATKGSITKQSSSVHQIIDTPVESHSKKPDITREKIIKLCGDIPRIELFAREKTEGWDVWGNEING